MFDSRILCVSCGFVITRLDIYPAVAARGVGQVLLVRFHLVLASPTQLIRAPLLSQNIAYPCLIFSKIVPAFTSQNIAALGTSVRALYGSYGTTPGANVLTNYLGPLVLVATLYEAIGIGIAWVVKQFFWVPHRFRYGILVAGGWSNVGDVRKSSKPCTKEDMLNDFC